MIKPAVVSPEDEVTTVAQVFGAPLVVKGLTWLPLTQLVGWGIATRWLGERHPKRAWWERLGAGAFGTLVVLGSEWCHNLAHTAAGWLVGKPFDVIRVNWGMPLLVCYDVNDESVTPHQHVARALGGPLVNMVLYILARLFRRRSPPGSLSRDVASAAVSTNAFLSTVSLLPIPFIDGGPILKWSLVARGWPRQAADEVMRKVNGVLGVGLAAGGAAAFKKKRNLLGAFLSMLAVTALGFGLGWIKEQE